MKISTWNPFRLRNVAVAALALGILAGIWLGDLFKGFGWGPGAGGSSTTQITPAKGKAKPTEGAADLVGYHDDHGTSEDSTPVPSSVVKVLIDDRSYYVRSGDKKRSISLEALVDLIERTEPNEDGLRAVVDRTDLSRVSAEIKLFEALKRAGVSDNAVYLTPQAVE